MNNSERIKSDYGELLKMMHQVRKTLAMAGAPETTLSNLSAVLKYLADKPESEVQLILSGSYSKKTTAKPSFDLDVIATFTDAQVEETVTNESTPRKVLEEIATGRFKVPRGSVRSFTRISDLREKLLTLLQNEKTHQAISDVVGDRKNTVF